MAIELNKEREDDTCLWDNNGAADYLNVAPNTMKQSRSTGVLLGKPAPEYIKMGRLVRYQKITLRDWVAQFGKYRTAKDAKEKIDV